MNTTAIQIDPNNPQAMEWADTVGRFFRSFALIELLTVEFARRMADPFKFKSMKKKFLAQRLTWISDTIHEKAGGNPEKADELIEALDDIREISYFRNILAHGALAFSFPEGESKDSPAIAGILNFKPDDEDVESELIPIGNIKEKLEESEALARKLLDLLNQLEFTATET